MDQYKGTSTHVKRTRWAVSEIYLATINCLENPISLLTILSTEYLVVIEELLGERMSHEGNI
jgi:hypothetical protein